VGRTPVGAPGAEAAAPIEQAGGLTVLTGEYRWYMCEVRPWG